MLLGVGAAIADEGGTANARRWIRLHTVAKEINRSTKGRKGDIKCRCRRGETDRESAAVPRVETSAAAEEEEMVEEEGRWRAATFLIKHR